MKFLLPRHYSVLFEVVFDYVLAFITSQNSLLTFLVTETFKKYFINFYMTKNQILVFGEKLFISRCSKRLLERIDRTPGLIYV